MNEFGIVSHGDGEYGARLPSHDGHTSLTVVLSDADDASGGRLADDEATAVAMISFLLEHQEATDLPERIEIEDVLAAYPDAVDRIVTVRG